MITLLTLTTFLLQATTITGAESLIILVLGMVGSFVVQGIKKFSGIDGNKAFFATVGVSLILALGAVWFTGGFTLGVTITAILAVLGTATVTYNWIIKNLPEFNWPTPNNTTTTNG